MLIWLNTSSDLAKTYLTDETTRYIFLVSKAEPHMKNRFRRFEMILPLQFNDGSDVTSEWLAEADLEIAERFNSASYETQRVDDHWR